MPYSKFDAELEFNENEWVVTMINTGKGIDGILAGHAKVIVEGVKKNEASGLFDELFIAEYHIMEAEGGLPDETWIPQAFRNTKSKYAVIYREDNRYELSDEKYAKVQARSKGGIKPDEVMKMIQNIKQEQQDIVDGVKEGNFQYAGKWCFYSYNGGHNCTTWVEEKLGMIGAGQYFITDSTKSMPFVHANSNRVCNIL